MSYSDVYNIEKELESAYRKAIDSVIGSSVCSDSLSTDARNNDFIFVKADVSSPTGRRIFKFNTWVFDQFIVNLEIVTGQDRHLEKDTHENRIFQIRQAVASFNQLLDRADLPNLDVLEISDESTSRELDNDDGIDMDLATLTYQVVVGIRSDAWPV